MKTITKLTLLAASFALVASSAFADDQQLRNRLDLQQRADIFHQNGLLTPGAYARERTTIGVYAGRHGVSRSSAPSAGRSEVVLMRRDGTRGTTFYFAPAK